MDMPASPKPTSRSSSLPKLLCTLVAVFLLGCVAGAVFTAPTYQPTTSAAVEEMPSSQHVRKHKRPFVAVNGNVAADITETDVVDPFILTIVVQFNTMEGLSYFKKIFTPFAQWIQKNEHGTLSYSLAISDKDPLQTMIFEQYVDKHAHADIHKKSPQFLSFKQKMVAMNDEAVQAQLGWQMTGQSYLQSVGFI
jgi:quinol monooxygenase YgiN